MPAAGGGGGRSALPLRWVVVLVWQLLLLLPLPRLPGTLRRLALARAAQLAAPLGVPRQLLPARALRAVKVLHTVEAGALQGGWRGPGEGAFKVRSAAV